MICVQLNSFTRLVAEFELMQQNSARIHELIPLIAVKAMMIAHLFGSKMGQGMVKAAYFLKVFFKKIGCLITLKKMVSFSFIGI